MKLLNFFKICTILLPIYANSQQFEFNFGRAELKPFIENESEIFTCSNNEYYIINKKKFKAGELNPKVQIEKFDQSNNRVLNADVTTLSQYDYVKTIVLKNKAYVLESVFDRDNQKNVLMAYEVNGFIKSKTGSAIATFNAEKLSKRGRFKVSLSDNLNFLTVLAEPEFIKGENEKIEVTLFNDDFKELWKSLYEFNYEFARVVDNNILVSDEGNVYIIRKTNIKGNYTPFSIFSFNQNKTWSEFKIDLLDEKKKIVSYKTAFSTKGELTLGGFYTEDGRVVIGGDNIDGMFMCKLSLKGENRLLVNTSEFKNKRKNLVLRNMLTDENDNMFLTSEKVVIDENVISQPINQSNPNSFFKEPLKEYKYTVNYIYVDGISLTGNNLFNYELYRPFETKNDFNIHSSTLSYLTNNELVLFFIDFEHRYKEKKFIVVNPKLSLIYQTLNKKTGEVLNSISFKDNNESYMQSKGLLINPSIGKLLSSNKRHALLVRLENNDSYKMGTINISY
jgi:hypothetical protein